MGEPAFTVAREDHDLVIRLRGDFFDEEDVVRFLDRMERAKHLAGES